MNDVSVQSSRRVPGDLRKMASSPDNHPQNNAFFSHETPAHLTTTGHPYKQEAIDTQRLSADRQLDQLMRNLGSISRRHQNEAIPDGEVSDSHWGYEAPGPRGQYIEDYLLPPNGVRTMHSAPDLMQRPNPMPNADPASSFLQDLHPRTTQPTEYARAIPTSSHHSLIQDRGDVSNVPSNSRVLRRVPRFPMVNAAGMQQRPVYDKVPSTGPACTMVGHALSMEFFALQIQAADDTQSVARYGPIPAWLIHD
jgi:hypothetical protein